MRYIINVPIAVKIRFIMLATDAFLLLIKSPAIISTATQSITIVVFSLKRHTPIAEKASGI